MKVKNIWALALEREWLLGEVKVGEQCGMVLQLLETGSSKTSGLLVGTFSSLK